MDFSQKQKASSDQDLNSSELKDLIELLADLANLNSSSFDEERAKRQAEIKRLEAEIVAQKQQSLTAQNLVTTPIQHNLTQPSKSHVNPHVKPSLPPISRPLENSFSPPVPTPVIEENLWDSEDGQKSFTTSNLPQEAQVKSIKQNNNPSYHVHHENDTMTVDGCQDIFAPENGGNFFLGKEEEQEEDETNFSSYGEQNLREVTNSNQLDQEITSFPDPPELKEDIELLLFDDQAETKSLTMSLENLEYQLNLPPLNSTATRPNFAQTKLTQSVNLSSSQPQNNKTLEQENVDEKLQSLLAEMLLPDSQKQMSSLEGKINSLERQINEPEELIKLLLPLIADLLNLKVLESKEDIVKVIVPIIDEIIKEKSQQDKEAMIAVMANIIPGAISKQILDQPQEVIQAIAPAMGESIKEQIRIEKDAMVDALYPVIGHTISKYMGEVIKQINSKVESTFSVEGIRRKIRAKMQGVSEAELILKESMPFRIKAIFLIHKASGLVISEAQPQGKEKLEGDMLAGMLTAIRSFASECSINPQNTSELTEIEYENSKIMMEVAGYCYLAVIIEGEATKEFIKEIKHTLGSLILNFGYNNFIKQYEGDEDTVPQPIHDLLEALLNYREINEEKKAFFPLTLLIIIVSLLSLITIPLGLSWHRQRVENRLENTAKIALSSTPEIAVYRLDVNVEKGKVILTGKLPNQTLKEKAAEVITENLPQLIVKNEILAVDVPPDPILIKGEVQRLTKLFNQRESVIINTIYENNEVTINGSIRNEKEAQQISQSFRAIPGIKNVFITLTPKAFPIDQRFYFHYDSDQLNQIDIKPRIKEISQFLKKYPQLKIKIIGHTDPTGTEKRNQQLAKDRALTIKYLLIEQGIDPERLIITGIQQPPDDVYSYDPLWLGRCVRFERVM